MMNNYKKFLKDITTFILDVDGVMTNGKIIYTHDGKIDRQFEAKDGYAIKHAISKGYNFVIISGGTQHNVKKRLNSLGVEDVFLNAFDKLKIFNDYISKTKDKVINTLIFKNWIWIELKINDSLHSNEFRIYSKLKFHIPSINIIKKIILSEVSIIMYVTNILKEINI